MGKVTLQKDLLFAAFAALVIHLGVALCPVSISSPPVYLKTENQRHLKILALTRTAEVEKPPVLPDVKKKEKETSVEEDRKITGPDVSTMSTSRLGQKKEPRDVKSTEAVPLVETASVAQPVHVVDSTSTEKVERGVIGSPNGTTDMPAPVERAPETLRETLAAPRYGENPPPVYPMIARRKGYEGVVLLSVEVLSDGRVAQVKIKKSSGYAVLDTSALEAVKGWKFEPARRTDIPVTVWVHVPVKFVLKDT